MFIRSYMTPSPITITPEKTVAEAIGILEQHNIRHLLVVNELGQLAGILSDRDLRSARPSSVARSKERQNIEIKVNNTPVDVLMTRECLTVNPSSTLDDALLLFQSKKIGALPVVGDEDKVVGIFTTADLINAYRALFGLGEKGSVLISIEDQGDPQAMSRLVQLMEENRVTFTRLVRSGGGDQGQPMIFLRINTYNIRSMYKALEAAGFIIHVPEELKR
ncbi:CBS domain-containing protein [Desulfobulbus oligotrophicus]|uniref:CBS domain-containing protein n=1 Tax=Desulfobulbus oligotrophicus TaxID=1909699 RepID=A0A7T6AR55_9BACT|nr:CBS domain-containing protein [Desulfobulbus oligotrophicus]MDY0391039.1 CBS domain-containing protein [Desulfobulbus oligotrophicus]QQG66217.1 CBS domain-containing protein [Desulfobulbus oligotrophicus]